jgi:SAM-dependent methyltransferase
MSDTPQIFDRKLLRARLKRFDGLYNSANFLKARVTEDMIETLSAINRHFDLALELNARDQGFADTLANSDAAGRIGFLIQSDIDGGLMHDGARLVLDEETLPFGDDSLNLIVSGLGLHWANDLPGVLVQIRRALKPDGLFIGTMFGGETLKELRTCLMEAEIEVRGGYGPRIAPFAEAYDVIALMRRIGFTMPVVDSDKVTVSYDNPLALMRDLRAMGEGNVMQLRPRKGLNRAIISRASEIYFERFVDDEGRITATFEIITLSGWKAHESQQTPLKPGSAKVRLADALGVKEGKL